MLEKAEELKRKQSKELRCRGKTRRKVLFFRIFERMEKVMT
jgi:hypothetical protein